MTEPVDRALERARRRRLIKIAAAAGGALGLACHLLPADYHDACRAIVRAASLAVGGC